MLNPDRKWARLIKIPMKNCSLCQREEVENILDLGRQPVCHRFLSMPTEDEYTHPVSLGQCRVCGLVQLDNPMPIDELRPRYDWIECTEPEKHLDQLVTTLSQLPGIERGAKICGISFKEDSTLRRFHRLGFENTWRIDPKTELGIEEPFASVETVVNAFTPERASAIAKLRGRADIVIARHLIEHAVDIRRFMKAVRNLVAPDGYAVFEIPDCQRALERCDYTTYWEEHTVYFTPETFRNCFSFEEFSLSHFQKAEYPLEDSYIGIVRIQEGLRPVFPTEDKLAEEMLRAQHFSERLPQTRRRFRAFLKEYRQRYGKVAIFGAAHMCCTFVNILELKDYIEFVVDDNPHKDGMYMPGSHLPILGSWAIVDKDIKLCLLTLSPASEEKVIGKNREFLLRGGELRSIFPGNPLALAV